MGRFVSGVRAWLCLLFGLVVVVQPVGSVRVEGWDPVQWIFCNLDDDKGSGFSSDDGKNVLKATRTDWLPYLLASKSSTVGSDDAGFNFYNSLLRSAGYRVGRVSGASNVFERFGFAGLKFSSYLGEWKYYNVDPCDTGDRQLAKGTNYGVFYEGRKDPLSTFQEVSSSKDVRTRVYSVSRVDAFFKAFRDNLVNSVFAVAKFVTVFTLVLVSLSLTDVSSLLGFSDGVQKSLVASFYSGLFLPLVVLMIVFSGVYLFWKGVRREFRSAFVGGLVKPLVAFFCAVLLGSNPSLVSLPSRLSVAGQALVVSAMEGSVSGDGSSGLCETKVAKPSKDGGADGFLKGESDYLRAVIGCRLWSEFLLKPLVKGQFGSDFGKLEVLGNENASWVGKPEVFVNAGKKVSNWGLFHVSVLSGFHEPLDGVNGPLVGGVNKDFYRIVDALSNYEETYLNGGSGELSEASDGGGSSGGSGSGGVAVNPAHWSSGDPYTHVIVGHVRKGITAEQLDGFLASTGIAYDRSRINGAKLLRWQERSKVDVRAIIAIAMMESSLGTRGVAVNVPGANMFGFYAFDSDPSQAGRFNDERAIVELARQTLIGNKNLTFKRQDDKARANAEGRLNTAVDGGVYFTSTSGHGEKRARIMARVDAFVDAHGGADDGLSDIGSVPEDVSDDGDDGGSSVVPVPKNNPVLEQWDFWVGNRSGFRFGYAFLSVLFGLFGSVAPLVFAFLAVLYGVGLTILTVLSPVFLLLGCWGGRGNAILVRFFGSLVSLFVKRIVVTVLLVVSIIVVSNTMELVNSVGVFKAVAFLVVVSWVLVKNRRVLVDKMSDLNMGQLGLQAVAGQVFSRASGAARQGLELAGAGVVGGVSALREKGSFKDGAVAGLRQGFYQKLQMSDVGRRANIVRRALDKGVNSAGFARGQFCSNCGSLLGENLLAYVDDNGNMLCDVCASAEGYEGMTQVRVDNREDRPKPTGNDSVVMVNAPHRGGRSAVSYLSNGEVAGVFGLTRGADAEVWFRNKEALMGRVNDSMAVMLADLDKVRSSPGTTGLSDFFVPDPLRSVVTPHRMEQVMELMGSDPVRACDEYEAVMRDGWSRWFSAQAKRFGDSDIDTDLNSMVSAWDDVKDSYGSV